MAGIIHTDDKLSGLAKLAPFLPRGIAAFVPESGRVVERRGSLLFADISGFTALTERLGRAGREGAEELTIRINGFFEKLLEVIRSYQGDILKFGGDAMLIGLDESLSPSAAVACARDLFLVAGRAGHLRTKSGRFRLGLHVGISFGPYYELVSGDARRRMEQFFFGTAVHQCQKAADLATSGEVVAAMPARFANTLSGISLTRRARGFYLLTKAKSGGQLSRSGRQSAVTPQRWWPRFLDPAVVSLITGQKQDWIGDHRAVTVAFIFYKGSDRWPTADAAEMFGRILAAMDGALTKWGGVLSRNDPGSAYQKLLCLFGAPQTGERDPQSAVGFALELQNRFAEIQQTQLPFDFGIGLATGRVFCGFVGGTARREYTIMGDAANLAARLAVRSFGGLVTADQSTAREASGRYLFKPLSSVRVKGKAARVRLFRPVSHSAGDARETVQHAAEYYPQILKALAHFARRRPADRGYGIVLAGEAGCGKTSLAGRFIGKVLSPERRAIKIALWPEEHSIALSGLSRILAEVFGAGTGDLQDLRRRFQAAWPREVDHQWQPLFADVLGINLRTTALVRGLDRQMRMQKLTELFPRIVSAAVPRDCRAIFIDNYQWLDPSSTAVLRHWWSNILHYPLALIAACRDDQPLDEGWSECADINLARLGSVDESDIVRLVKARFPEVEPPRRLIAELINRARAVPAIADVYLDHWVEEGLLSIDPRNLRRLHIENLAADDLPDALMAAYVRRLDLLPPEQREIIHSVAVWGGAVTLNQLKHLLSGNFSTEELASQTSALERSDYLVGLGNDTCPAFSIAHPLMAQAAYQTMSFLERRKVHALAAQIWQRRRERGSAAILARHLMAAGDELSAVPALLAAAREALPVGAFWEARNFLRDAERMLARRPVDKLRLEIIEKLADVEQKLGNYDNARRLYNRAIKMAPELDKSEKPLLLKLALGRLYWIAGNYDRCQKTAVGILRHRYTRDNRLVSARARHLLGEVWRRRGQFEKAEHMLQRSLDDFVEIGDKSGMLEARNTLGIVSWNQGRLAEATAHFRAGLNLGSSVVDLASRARLYNNLGILYEEQAFLKRAHRQYQRAFEIFTTIGHRRNRAYCLGNLANIHRLRGHFDPAREGYEEVLRETNAIGEAHAHAYTIGNLGDLYADFGDFERARPLYRQTLAFARRADDDELKAETVIRMAVVARARGRQKLFNARIAEAAKLAREAGSAEFQLRAELFAASDQRSRGKSEQVVPVFHDLLERATDARLILYQVLCREELARAYLATGRQTLARRNASLALKQARSAGFGLVELRLTVMAAEIGIQAVPSRSGTRRINNHTRRCIQSADEKAAIILSHLSDNQLKETLHRCSGIQHLHRLCDGLVPQSLVK